MEVSGSCKSCRKRCLIRDEASSCVICSSCGIVQDFDDYQAPFGGISGPQGTFVRVGTSGTGSTLNYRNKKIFEAHKTIDDILFRLEISGSKSIKVKEMIEKVTEGEFGLGDWFPILVGACAYVVMRNDKKPLPIAEVVSVIGCDIYELGKMVGRVVEFLDLKMPEFDVVNSFERAIRRCPSYTRVSSDKVEVMLKQGIFLMQCSVKWFLTTGRRPLPMIAAVLVFVAKLNQVDVCFEDVAKEVNAAVVTSKLRYKELLEALVKVAKGLPWGKDITTKNIMKNAPFVIQYMEIKSRSKSGEKRIGLEDVGFCMEDVVSDGLMKEPEYNIDKYGSTNDSQCYGTEEINGETRTDSVRSEAEGRGGLSRTIFDDLEQLNISYECSLMNYSQILDRASQVEERSDHGRKRKSMTGLSAFDQWWSGKSELCKKLFLEQVLEKDVGLDPPPPSFVNGQLANDRRRGKIKAAKLRINKVMNPPNSNLGNADESCELECLRAGKKGKGRCADIDWEDIVVETLLLHNVKAEEIETGHYKALLGLHVFNSGVV